MPSFTMDGPVWYISMSDTRILSTVTWSMRVWPLFRSVAVILSRSSSFTTLRFRTSRAELDLNGSVWLSNV